MNRKDTLPDSIFAAPLGLYPFGQVSQPVKGLISQHILQDADLWVEIILLESRIFKPFDQGVEIIFKVAACSLELYS